MLLVCFINLHELHGALHGLDLVGTVCVLVSVLVNMFFKFVALLLTIMACMSGGPVGPKRKKGCEYFIVQKLCGRQITFKIDRICLLAIPNQSSIISMHTPNLVKSN